MINANAHKKVTPQADAGTHMARVVGVVDLGHQPSYEYQGEIVPSAYKIEITYELVDHHMEDDRPFWVSEEVKLSNHEASKLYKRLQVLDPSGTITKGGNEVDKLIGLPAMVDVKPNAKGYAQINNVGGVPAGIEVSALTNPAMLFSTEQPDAEVFKRLSKFTKKKIAEGLDKTEELQKLILENQDDF